MRIVFLVLALALSGPVAALSVQPSERSDLVLILVAPWQDSGPILEAVDGREIGPRRAPFGILAQSTDPAVSRIAYEAGALWVTDGTVLAAICGASL